MWFGSKKQYQRLAAGMFIIVAITGGAYFFMAREQKAVTTVRTVAAEKGTVAVRVSATGTISAVNSVDVSSKVTGLIKEVKVKENDVVKAGQVLVVLDDTAINAQLRQMKAKLDNSSVNYERAKSLHSIGAYSGQRLDSALLEYEVAKTNYDNTASNLGDYVILAPIDGEIIGKPTPAGQTVSQGISTPMVIMTLADLSKMQIEALIDESDIGKIEFGQKVTFTVDSYPEKIFTGTVAQISNKATTQNNVIYYTVYISIDAPVNLLKPAMTARLTVYVTQQENVLTVPNTAIKEVNGRKTVQVLLAGNTRTVEVETGLTGEDATAILSGLRPGDQVVLPLPKAQKADMGPPNPFR